MTWSELLFAHWPIAPELVATRLPRGLELDTFDGTAWLGVVPFRMSGVRLFDLPSFGFGEEFPELNLRTYVRRGDRPGVWFFSLDAASPLAVAGARAWFQLPYFTARMSCESRADGSVKYTSSRLHPGAPDAKSDAKFGAKFEATYAPVSEARHCARGSLEHFLVERYCLYSTDAGGRLTRGEIDHAPWPVHDACAEFSVNQIAFASGFELVGAPKTLHFVRSIDVTAWAPVRVDES